MPDLLERDAGSAVDPAGLDAVSGVVQCDVRSAMSGRVLGAAAGSPQWKKSACPFGGPTHAGDSLKTRCRCRVMFEVRLISETRSGQAEWSRDLPQGGGKPLSRDEVAFAVGIDTRRRDTPCAT